MEIEMNREFLGKVMNDPSIDRVLLAAAAPIAARLRGTTPRRSGRTAGSTRITSGHQNAKRDRRAVRITQSFGAVPQDFARRGSTRNRNYMARGT